MATIYQRGNGTWVVAWTVPAKLGARRRQQRTFRAREFAEAFMSLAGMVRGTHGKGRWRSPTIVALHIRANTAPTADGCHNWTGPLMENGYGRLMWTAPQGSRMSTAHRVAYHVLVGPIPDGLQIDHLCRNRACVNPAHLEPVTAAENLRRARVAKAGAVA